MGFTENWIEAAGSVALSGKQTTAEVAGNGKDGREAAVGRTEENGFKGSFPPPTATASWRKPTAVVPMGGHCLPAPLRTASESGEIQSRPKVSSKE